MRFLKKKIALAKTIRAQNKKLPYSTNSLKKRNRVKGACLTPATSRPTKNIVKNYAKAICKFVVSSMGFSYLIPIIEREGVDLKRFIDFVNKSKVEIDGLCHFRAILLPNVNDNKEMISFRRIFRSMGEIFIKYFSVNWIFDSKVVFKIAHLNFRFKMLRRIRSPEWFTYLKG